MKHHFDPLWLNSCDPYCLGWLGLNSWQKNIITWCNLTFNHCPSHTIDASFPLMCLESFQNHQKQVCHVPEDQNEVKKSSVGWIELKLWPKTLIACKHLAGRGGASGATQWSPGSSTHNSVNPASILEIFVSKYTRKKQGIHWRCQFSS